MPDHLPSVLIVTDAEQATLALADPLRKAFDVHIAQNCEEALQLLAEEWVQIMISNECVLCTDGKVLSGHVQEKWPEVVQIVITHGAQNQKDHGTSGKQGETIYHYVSAPAVPNEMVQLVKHAAQMFELKRQNDMLALELRMARDAESRRNSARRARASSSQYSQEDGIIRTDASPMNAVCRTIRQIAAFDLPVLITGESGTGKELAARSLHANSLRWNKPFVVENCAALSAELLESELFGHKRGAFTGAVEDHIGLFERADGGTIFLDEIGEVAPSFQVKLLRVLQEGEIRPVGANKTLKVNVRVIAATNRDMDEEVRQERFRKDLYFRLAGIVVHMPMLKDRPCDIPALADYLLKQAVSELGKPSKGFTDEAIACMRRYQWPGNVREMRNEIQRMLVMSPEDGMLEASLLSPRVLQAMPEEEAADLFQLTDFDGPLKSRIEKLEASILQETLVRNRWNKSKAAKELGLSRVGLRGKLLRYGLEKPGESEDCDVETGMA